MRKFNIQDPTPCPRDAKGPVYAPKTVEFADALPITPLGKPDSKAIREQLWTNAEPRCIDRHHRMVGTGAT